MNEQVADWETSTNVEAPPADPNAPPPAEAAPAPPAEAAAEGDETPPESTDPDAQLGRDAKGRFRPRHRARSQEAGPQDAPRIRELTKKLRQAEARSRELESKLAPSSSSTPTTLPPSSAAPSSQPAASASSPDDAFGKPEPDLQQMLDTADPAKTYAQVQQEWHRAWNEWNAEKAAHEQGVATRKAAAEREESRITENWRAGVAAGEKKYPDFRKVALESDTRIPKGSLIDAWILEHKVGWDVLYTLQKNPAELDRLLPLSPIEQAYELALLSQRLTAPRAQAASTGSAAPEPPRPAPRPPNPVRTGPTKSGDEMPGDTDSLEDHEAYFHGSRRGRRAR